MVSYFKVQQKFSYEKANFVEFFVDVFGKMLYNI